MGLACTYVSTGGVRDPKRARKAPSRESEGERVGSSYKGEEPEGRRSDGSEAARALGWSRSLSLSLSCLWFTMKTLYVIQQTT